jgi:large subunit ribosomal protein L25
MEEVEMELNAFDRTQNLAALRADGMLPAVIYDKKTNRSVYVERKAFDKAFRQVSTHGIITLKFEDGASLDIMVKDVSMNKKKRIVQHADFLIVSDEPLEVSVPVHTKGVSKAVKEDNAVLDIVMHTVVVKATPKSIPQEIIVDITELALGHPIHASDLILPTGVKLVTDASATVIMVHQSRAAEEVAPVVAAPVAEPEVIKKGKPEEK